MVLALGALQDGKTAKCSGFLLATVLIGSCFLSVQVYEYYQLMVGHHYPPGISATGHFRPSVSLFASCFFTMTGFHGAHVFGGVVMLTCIFIQSLRGAYSRNHYSPVELVGLYLRTSWTSCGSCCSPWSTSSDPRNRRCPRKHHTNT